MEKLKEFEKNQYYSFFTEFCGNIEITTEFDVLRIYFPLQPVCFFLTEKTKQ